MINHVKFKEFVNAHASYVNFAATVGSSVCSKSTIDRLVKPNAFARMSGTYWLALKPALISAIQSYCRDSGKTPEETEQIISEIFEGDYQPMITHRQKLDDAQLEFFKLERDPFALESDPRSIEETFTDKSLERLAKKVENAIKFQGFLAVLGPIGAGKTELKKFVSARLRKAGTYKLLFPAFAEMKKVSAGGITHYVLEMLGQKPRARLILAQHQLKQHLQILSEQNIHVSLCFDECHRLDRATLTSLKNFYELGSGGYDRYLGLILFGQPQFKTLLLDVEFQEIAERIETVEMPRLSNATKAYLEHRLKLVDANVDELFSASAIRFIGENASTPLAIGNLANKGLKEAYKRGDSQVVSRHYVNDEPRSTKTKSAAL